jgi:hypothetical protein
MDAAADADAAAAARKKPIEVRVAEAIDEDIGGFLGLFGEDTGFGEFVAQWRARGMVRMLYCAPAGGMVPEPLLMHMLYRACLRPLLAGGAARAPCVYAAYVLFATQQYTPRLRIRVTPELWHRLLAIQADAATATDTRLRDAARIIAALRGERAFVFTVAEPQIRKQPP